MNVIPHDSSQEDANTPSVPAAHFVVDTRTVSNAIDLVSNPLRIGIPKTMIRRRIYALVFSEQFVDDVAHVFPTYSGVLDFRLNGCLVYSMPFSRNRNLTGPSTQISIRSGAEGLSDSSNVRYEGFQPATRDCLLVTTGISFPLELVIPPTRIDITADSVELKLDSHVLLGQPNGDKALIACHSEGYIHE